MNNELSAFWQAIEKASNPIIICDNSGDAISAGLALADFLAAAGKNPRLVCGRTTDQRLNFLPGFEQIAAQPDSGSDIILGLKLGANQVKAIKYRLEEGELLFTISLDQGDIAPLNPFLRNGGYGHDLVITLGVAELSSLGELFERHSDLFYQTDIINIDNNFTNDNYGQVNIIDLKAAAITEIVFALLDKQQAALSGAAATCLLAGLISRTRNFKTGNITPHTLETASTLVKLGADRDLIVTELYRKKSLKLLKLWGLVLAKLSASDNRQLLWTSIQREQFEAAGGQDSDLLSLIEEVLVSLADTLAIAIFITDHQGADTLLYSAKNLDALYLGQHYQAQGDKKLARFRLDNNQSEHLNQVAQELREQIEKITGN